jgi:threonylcarbamoyladenosine tRNA methylthiotransferase MtaB
VLTGCYVTGQPEEAAQLAGVDLIVPNRAKDSLVERIAERFPELLPDVGSSDPDPAPCSPLEFGNSRALVKIEDGCNMRCSFCIIPATRGSRRSRPLAQVVEEVIGLDGAGYSEVVITGVQISAYRWEESGLYELTRILLERTPVARLRLTSIAPWQFDSRLLELFSWSGLCRHLHLSLQSGCSATLRRMRRPYEARSFAKLVDSVRAAVPGIAITTDLIIGFPGETEKEFEESLEFVRTLEFAQIHAFPFSPRGGTEAAELGGQVPFAVKRSRMERALEVARLSRQRFAQRHVDRSAPVLWEYRKEGCWYGLSDNYLRTVTRCDADLAGRVTPVRFDAATSDGLHCSVLESRPQSPPPTLPSPTGETRAGV